MMSEWWLQPAAAEWPEQGRAAEARQAQLTKPAGSLGQMEKVVVHLAALQGRERPRVDAVSILLFAGDHGVAAEGVSAFPQAVTGQMLRNFASGGAAINVLARHLGARLEVYDLGLASPIEALPGVRHYRIAPGTANFAQQPAMTERELLSALAVGDQAATAAAERGCELLLGGEMGIGNTTSACALGAALCGLDPARLVGAGTGLDGPGIAHKLELVRRALALHGGLRDAPLHALRCLGGLEVAALTGAYISAAQRGVPVLVDGYITTAAALCAVRINPSIRPWLLFGHRSAEPGHRLLLDALDAEPLLDLGMRLGEGSGAAVAVSLLRSACALHSEMATFAEAAVAAAP
ncbi:nicotinate-nucleotide--dimethylbenzimidazole phosphoribosyltransferase [Pseudomonas sp.]|uniref:nicotinate-nucleotide--dimethylbenzimidazole phosphoribosyltransferase n=1 Tax=Pseudomonas sp. TaxID=306 RepID=UPI003FA71BF8